MLEEFGWSGLAFPALQARYGFLRAGAAMGCIVAVWHLPFFFTPGTTQSRSSFLVFLLTVVPARIGIVRADHKRIGMHREDPRPIGVGQPC